jgi:hypothetical protein
MTKIIARKTIAKKEILVPDCERPSWWNNSYELILVVEKLHQQINGAIKFNNNAHPSQTFSLPKHTFIHLENMSRESTISYNISTITP